MKFTIQSTSAAFGRKAIISDFPRLPGLVLETPALMLYTKSGSVPHLTREVLDMLPSLNDCLLEMPLPNCCQLVKGTLKADCSLAEFSGLGPHPSLLMQCDPLQLLQTCHSQGDRLPMWTRAGKKLINADDYMNMMEALKPDVYTVFSDGCTGPSTSNKRAEKAVKHSESMLDLCLKRHASSHHLSRNATVLGVIQGGYNLKQRELSLETLKAAEGLGGYVLDGLEINGPALEKCSFQTIQPIVEAVTNSLPSDKLRIVPGCFDAATVVELVRHGWDVLDSSAAYLASERGEALSFCFQLDTRPEDTNYQLDLTDKKYAEDFGPLVAGCCCLACRKYTRAYVHHLLCTNEMLSGVLLMMHNLHHYAEFFKAIRECAASQRLSQLQCLLAEQCARRVFVNKASASPELTRRTKRFSIDATEAVESH